MNEIDLMMGLFSGRRDIYGIAKGRVERADPGKVWPAAMWERLFLAHLAGDANADLGIYPVTDADTVMFAAVDIDEPNLELALEIADLIPAANVWIERSRSGNYHVFVFFDLPCPAFAARAVLREVCLATGHPELEVFPKQDGLKPGMVGNYISIPWHGVERPIVWGKPGIYNLPAATEIPVDRAKWLEFADRYRTNPQPWIDRAKAMGAKSRDRREAESNHGERNSLHVCADYIFERRESNPLQVGHRAVVLFNLAKMYANCRHYSEDEAVQFVGAVNDAGEQPIPQREVERFVHNAFEGEFTSTGCDEPQMAPYVSPNCKIARG